MQWFGGKRRIEVPCTVEIEQTAESLHAHVTLDGGLLIAPGDEVTVYDAPTSVPYGACRRTTASRCAPPLFEQPREGGRIAEPEGFEVDPPRATR
jgi:hypothetical protein